MYKHGPFIPTDPWRPISIPNEEKLIYVMPEILICIPCIWVHMGITIHETKHNMNDTDVNTIFIRHMVWWRDTSSSASKTFILEVVGQYLKEKPKIEPLKMEISQWQVRFLLILQEQYNLAQSLFSIYILFTYWSLPSSLFYLSRISSLSNWRFYVTCVATNDRFKFRIIWHRSHVSCSYFLF